MKKRITLLFIMLVVCFTLAACSEKKDKAADDTNKSENSDQTDDTDKVNEDSDFLASLETSEYVTLGEYKGITVEIPKKGETEEEIINYINNTYLKSQAVAVEGEQGTVSIGDTVTYSCVGKIDGEVFQGGSSLDTDWETLIGSGSMIPGFEEGFVGMAVGESKDIPVTFPENYEADKAGKEAVFTIEVHGIKRITYPELTDELLTELNSNEDTKINYETVEELRNAAKEVLSTDYENRKKTEIMSKVLLSCQFNDPPQTLIDQGLTALYGQYEGMAQMYGTTLEEFIQQMFALDKDQFDEEMKKAAIEGAKQSIMLEAIADAEGIEFTEEEMKAKAEEDYEKFGYESAEVMLTAVGKNSYRDFLVSNKVVEMIIESAIVK